MKRFPLPDLLKGFAVLLIVPVHIMETFIDYPGRESLFGKSLLLLGGPIAVPVFMMVMGYFLARSKRSFISVIFRGIKIFILGFLLNIGLNFNLLLKIKFEGWQFDPLEYIFGVDIFYLAGLSIVVLATLKILNKGQLLIVTILIFLFSGSTALINELISASGRSYFLPFIGGEYSWSYFPIFPWLTYPLIGFLFYRIENSLMKGIERNKRASWITGTVIFVLIVIFGRFGVLTTIDLSKYYHHTFLFFLWTMGVVILWTLLLRFVVFKFPEFPLVVFLSWLGKNITVFYIIQWLIIGNIATVIYQTKELPEFGYWFGGIFLVTVGLTYLIENRQKIRTFIIKLRVPD
ncbi:MAG: acyltransferase family protein [Bacteroidota bacterium]